MHHLRRMLLFGSFALALGVPCALAQPYAFGYSSFNANNAINVNGNLFDNFDSGWIDSNGNHSSSNTNYFSGDTGGDHYRNYFSFDLTTLSSPFFPAEFDVFTFDISNPGTFYIYGTTLNPSQVNSSNAFTNVSLYNQLASGPVIGSINLDPSLSNTTVDIAFNAAGTSWLAANAGQQVVLGGDFGQVATPEPATCLLIGPGLLAAAYVRRRRMAR